MKNMIKVVSLAGILAVVGIGGTFAYFNQTDTAVNEFWTGTYDMELVEEFKPKDGENWEPGTSVNKDVHVENQGSLPVVVRVKFSERWVARDEAGRQLYLMDTEDVAKASAAAAATPGNAFTAEELGMLNTAEVTPRNKFESVYQGDPDDGETGETRDDSVVHKVMDPESKWVYNVRDGYYYYTEVLPGKIKGENGQPDSIARTSLILDEVTLDENVDMGKFEEKKYYKLTTDAEDADWREYARDSEGVYLPIEEQVALVESAGGEIARMKAVPVLAGEELSGYRDADYILTVTAQTVQATDGAVASVFGLDAELQALLGLDKWNLAKEDTVYQGDEPVTGQSGQE